MWPYSIALTKKAQVSHCRMLTSQRRNFDVWTPYTIEDAVDDLFLDLESAERILTVWRNKKNLILQGPPGVGKTPAV